MEFLSLLLVTLMCVSTTGLALGVTWLNSHGYFPRNSHIGLRTKALSASDEAWRAGHAVAFRVLLALIPLGSVLITVQATAWAHRWSWDVITPASLIWSVVLAALVAVAIFLADRKAKKISSAPE